MSSSPVLRASSAIHTPSCSLSYRAFCLNLTTTRFPRIFTPSVAQMHVMIGHGRLASLTATNKLRRTIIDIKLHLNHHHTTSPVSSLLSCLVHRLCLCVCARLGRRLRPAGVPIPTGPCLTLDLASATGALCRDPVSSSSSLIGRCNATPSKHTFLRLPFLCRSRSSTLADVCPRRCATCRSRPGSPRPETPVSVPTSTTPTLRPHLTG